VCCDIVGTVTICYIGGVKQPLTPDDIAAVQAMIVHEDDDVIVFNKPSGLAVQSGRGLGLTLDDLLVAFAKTNGKRPRLVHRLDRGTSGLVIVAKTQPAAAHLSASFAGRTARKTYLAAVTPPPVRPSGTLDQALKRVIDGHQHMMVPCDATAPGAEAAKTTWRTLKAFEDRALVECRPHSGRMHQIRVHLQTLDAPIIGDALYGGDMAADRLHLHAVRLEIAHPRGGQLDLTAPVPDDLRAVWQSWGLV